MPARDSYCSKGILYPFDGITRAGFVRPQAVPLLSHYIVNHLLDVVDNPAVLNFVDEQGTGELMSRSISY